ncbi:MAG: hypothetical protein IKG82_13535, partial [Oscillospiraceae bacterium]|nr:hypothetical protein [Oscillospiraceae bacterium]
YRKKPRRHPPWSCRPRCGTSSPRNPRTRAPTRRSTAVITEQGKQNADVNGSGNIDLDDVTAILRKIAKLD